MKKVVSQSMKGYANLLRNIVHQYEEDNVKKLTLLGTTMHLGVFPNNPKEIKIPHKNKKYTLLANLSMDKELWGTSFNYHMNLIKNNHDFNLIGYGDIKINNLETTFQMDPLGPNEGKGIYNHWFQLKGKTTDVQEGFKIDLGVPVDEKETNEVGVSISDFFPVPKISLPGVVITNLDAGISLELVNFNKKLLEGLIFEIFRDTWSMMKDKSISLEWIIDFIKNMITEFINEVINLVKNSVKELEINWVPLSLTKAGLSSSDFSYRSAL